MTEPKELSLFTLNHVFMPPQLPQNEDLHAHEEQALCQTIHSAAKEFRNILPPNQRHLWNPITKLLKNFAISRRFLGLSEEAIARSMSAAQTGDVLAFLIRAQNSGVIIRKEAVSTVFELFEVSPPNKDIMATKGRLLCSFPGPAIQIPTQVFNEPQFQTEIARFLAAMDGDPLDSAPRTTKAKSKVFEVRDTEDPRYITQLLTEILRGMGDAAEVPRIRKRIGDEILWCHTYKPWRRSAVWLVLRVALQTTLVRQNAGHERYKEFMVFLHARILKLGLQSDLPSHLIDCMQKKTARRLSKLGSAASLAVSEFVDDVISSAEGLLQQRWALVQAMQATCLSSTWAPNTLDIAADTALTLRCSKEYLQRSLQDSPVEESSQFFNPDHSSRILGADNFSACFVDHLAIAFKSDGNFIALADFEHAVVNDLEDWANQNLLSGKGFATIATCIERYSDAASKAYASNPELSSLMHLTLFKLWVELDRMAIARCPLLAKFSPEVPSTLLHSLLLRTSELIEVLNCVESHLNSRHSHAIPGQSVFSSTTNKNSFAVQYFDGSNDLQSLKVRIEEDATLEKVKKLEELQRLSDRHQQLKNLASGLKCEYVNEVTKRGGSKTVHAKQCQKCELLKEATSMKIDVHEWPLPQHPLEAKVVVFELAPPLHFATWRRITYRLLRNIYNPGSQSHSTQPSHMELWNYTALRSYHTRGGDIPEIGLASTTKSFKKSHYQSQNVSVATDKSICLNHGLQWKLFHSARKEWVTQEVTKCTVNDDCTFQLPLGRYQSLQYAVSGTSHTSNEIMACQTEHSLDLTLHESFAFARIRSGPRLQWLNILSELRSDSLRFPEEAVYALLRQAAWQIGPLNLDGEREWHIEPNIVEYGIILLQELEELLLKLAGNCRNVIGMQVITMLNSRLLASSTDNFVVEKSLELMRKVRRVTYKWATDIASRLWDMEDENRMQELQMQACEMAATCRGTFDVDVDKAAALLLSADDVAIFTHCAILVYYNSPSTISNADVRIRHLLHRDRRLSHVMEPLLSQQIARFRDGLDQAILQVWMFYRPSAEWKHLPPPNNRWVTTHTAPQGIQRSQAVQLNILSGQLLIDGKPLCRLPQNFVTHPTYARIFGQRMLDVIPADIPGMDFKTSNLVGSNPGDATSGYQVFFALRDSEIENGGNQLVIRTQQDTEVLELIPHDVFNEDLPTSLIEDKVHWLNLSTVRGEIEVRDLETRWISSPHNWRINVSRDGISTTHMTLNNGSDLLRLIDPRSQTMSMISAQLGPLEEHQFLIATYSDSSRHLAVSLPRFRLEFFLNDELEPHLESHNMPGMIVDPNQSSDTMIGLKSQLVLCGKNSPEPLFRQVIIPYSPKSHFIISPSNYHSSATFSIKNQHVVRYLKYTVNSTLGRLEGDGSVLSRLYQIYLHAITSHCLPDPLTGHTGTEEALQGLRSAGVLSFQKLGEDERQMLQRISELTPTRTFYPPHLEVMQTVGWSKHTITPLGQHNEFRALTNLIWQYAKTLGMFSLNKDDIGCIDSRETSEYLLSRAGHRNGIFQRDQVQGASPPSYQHDTVYTSRGDSIYRQDADKGSVFNISVMVFNWESALPESNQLYDTLKQWGSISGIAEEISLAYSHNWLKRDIPKFFLSTCNACRTASKTDNRYQIAFSFCAWAYTSIDVRPLIPMILAFATVPQLRTLIPPNWPSYDLSQGLNPTEETLLEVILNSALPPEENAQLSPKDMHWSIAMQNKQCSWEIRELLRILKGKWPWEAPVVPRWQFRLFDTLQVERDASVAFHTCWRNNHLFGYFQTAQQIIDGVRSLTPTRSSTLYSFLPSTTHQHPTFNYLPFHQLFARVPPSIPQPPAPLRHDEISPPQPVHALSIATANSYAADREKNTYGHSFQAAREVDSTNLDKLRDLLFAFRQNDFLSYQDGSPARIQRKYADDLEESLKSLETEVKVATHQQGPPEPQLLDTNRYYHQCKEHLQATYEIIRESLLPSTAAEKTLFTAGLWPCLAARSLLGALSSGSNVLTEPWRKTLNAFARAILNFQRACRLRKYLHEKDLDEFSSELRNTMSEGHGDDEQVSIRLLIQVDCNFLARPIQIAFVKEMIAPSSGRNTALQLNMGEGKSSVIVPMVSAVLSDGHKLVRVVVLKQLASSMFQLLVHRLGGLVNRRVFYLPFSRSPRLSSDQALVVQDLLSTCIQVHGVLVVQPEHILSFKLMGLDRKFNSSTPSGPTGGDVASRLLKSQRWLLNHSRDILDESDEILHVRYQLTYTIGQYQSLQGSPDRWTIVQQTLSLISKHAKSVQCAYPDGIEVTDGYSGSYSHIRVLQDQAGTELIRLVAQDISKGKLEQCSFDLFPPHLRSLALSYILELDLASEDIHILEDYCKMSEIWNTLLIFRGLLAHGILLFVLKEKRWRVDYGLDPSRTLLAVPYRAKDVPSLRAEFSHPDVAILLTCLSYYWNGLSENQLEQCFILLFKQDNPVIQYDIWVRHTQSIPENLKHLSAINTYDLDQRIQLHQLFHQNKAVIDFFLSNVVFPRDAKEFPKKMATSGWDLAERKRHVTTGFSGTKDSGYLLPTSIDQADPLSQSSTNAKVLGYLFQPENDHYQCMNQRGQPMSEEAFLRLLNKLEPKIRVLLDVGAQILKLSNEEVAAEWLDSNSDRHVLAIVFFGVDDEPYVRSRTGIIEALVSSPFRQQMDRCLLYLDDVHTRGTDFKLPLGTRAAVTLGPKVTKDRLLQGCMRLRKLGYGHSVMFFAPPAVDHSIRNAAGLREDDNIEVKDILLWTMLESCLEVVHRISQWTQQGIDHRNREKAWTEFTKSPNTSIHLLESAWIRNEARSLDEMYAPHTGPKSAQSHQLADHPDISERYSKWARTAFSDSHIEEEEEREVIAEVETERQVERPQRAVPAVPHVHNDVRTLVQTGIFRDDSAAFVPFFQPVDGSSFEEHSWSSLNLFSTQDFSTTVLPPQFGDSSEYIRPVNWVLSAVQPTGTIFVVLSPHEVNNLMPYIRRSKKVHLHLYAPRVTQAMKSFENLTFHCIPPLTASWVKPDLEVTTRLNLWAGQLFLEDERAYQYLCRFLGLYSWEPKEDDVTQPDGFIKPEYRLFICSFEQSPVPYLKNLFMSRRKGMDYTPTHMGKILRGRLLIGEDFVQ